jgi:hypothetical protein
MMKKHYLIPVVLFFSLFYFALGYIVGFHFGYENSLFHFNKIIDENLILNH